MYLRFKNSMINRCDLSVYPAAHAANRKE